jgi:hypothetical protein
MDCGRCSSPTRERDVNGVMVQVCVACDAATLDWASLQGLITQPGPQQTAHEPVSESAHERPPLSAPPALIDDETPVPSLPPAKPPPLVAKPSVPPASKSPVNEPGLTGIEFKATAAQEPGLTSSVGMADDDDFEEQLRAVTRARRKRNLVYSVVMLGAVVILSIAVVSSVGIFQYLQSTKTVTVAPVPQTALVDATPEPEVGVVSVEPEAEPEPEPEPEPKPKPKPRIDSLQSLLSRGWSQVESNPAAAAGTFRKAIDMNGRHPEANYGYGYALLAQGNISGAKPFLCTAKAGNDIETQRDVNAMLMQHNLTCP